MGAVSRKELSYLKKSIERLKTDIEQLSTIVEVIETRDGRSSRYDEEY